MLIVEIFITQGLYFHNGPTALACYIFNKPYGMNLAILAKKPAL